LVTGGIDNSSIFAFIIHPSRTLSAQQQRRGPMSVSLFASSSYYSGGGDCHQYDNMLTIDEINQQKRVQTVARFSFHQVDIRFVIIYLLLRF
jgi:hypothetical protein